MLLPRDTQGSSPSAPALSSGAGAVLAPQDPWGQTLSRHGGQAGPGPTHSWVTAHSMTPGRDIPFTTALLPESRVSYVSAAPTLSWAWGPWHLQHAQMADQELVELCRGHPAPRQGSHRPFGPCSKYLLSRCPGSGCVPPCHRHPASGLERGPGSAPRSWQHVRDEAGGSRFRQTGKRG